MTLILNSGVLSSPIFFLKLLGNFIVEVKWECGKPDLQSVVMGNITEEHVLTFNHGGIKRECHHGYYCNKINKKLWVGCEEKHSKELK